MKDSYRKWEPSMANHGLPVVSVDDSHGKLGSKPTMHLAGP